MEISVETIVSIIGLLAGGGGIGGWFTYQYARRTAKAEAEVAETNATKEVQDVYQQLISDVKADRDEQKAYINELKDDRKHLREERDELRERIDKTEETVRNLRRDVDRNGRMVESLRPFICGNLRCRDRQDVTLEESVEHHDRTRNIEPLSQEDL
jgi:septal ring factor EnvC (AmiA/AmiB activator)